MFLSDDFDDHFCFCDGYSQFRLADGVVPFVVATFNSLRATLFFAIYRIFFLLAYVLCITFSDEVSVLHSNIFDPYMRYISYKVFGGVHEGRNLNDFSIIFFSFFLLFSWMSWTALVVSALKGGVVVLE